MELYECTPFGHVSLCAWNEENTLHLDDGWHRNAFGSLDFFLLYFWSKPNASNCHTDVLNNLHVSWTFQRYMTCLCTPVHWTLTVWCFENICCMCLVPGSIFPPKHCMTFSRIFQRRGYTGKVGSCWTTMKNATCHANNIDGCRRTPSLSAEPCTYRYQMREGGVYLARNTRETSELSNLWAQSMQNIFLFQKQTIPHH